MKSLITTALTILVLVGVPFLVLRVARFYFDVIEPYRKRTGYLVNYFGGREPGDGISVTYYEGDKELHFFSDRDERVFYVPDADLWNRIMPDFFNGKQAAVLQRITRRVPKRVSVTLVSAYPDDRFILYVDQSKTGPEKTLRIGAAAA